MFKKIANWFAKKRTECADALILERAVVVRFDDERISSTDPGGTVQSVSWRETNGAAIEKALVG